VSAADWAGLAGCIGGVYLVVWALGRWARWRLRLLAEREKASLEREADDR
jgi:hypothetical protein